MHTKKIWTKFEQAWLGSNPPELERYLEEVPEQERAELFVDLLAIEERVRASRGESPGFDYYRLRFANLLPGVERLVDEALERAEQCAPGTEPGQDLDTQLFVKGQSYWIDLPEHLSRYQLVRKIGEGAMGAVYLAKDPQLEREVAIKVPFVSKQDHDRILSRFSEEARSVAAVRHPNICPIYEVSEQDGVPFIVMAYIRGRSLLHYLGLPDPLEVERVMSWMYRIAQALAETHRQGVLHRDLKPANIMIDERGEPIIMDFGLARREKITPDTELTAQCVFGTPAYMAPERLHDGEATSYRSDIYSLGVVMYELLTGQRLYQGDVVEIASIIARGKVDPPSRKREDLESEIDPLCLKAMHHDPDQRYESMKAFADAILEYRRELKSRRNATTQEFERASRETCAAFSPESIFAPMPLEPDQLGVRLVGSEGESVDWVFDSSQEICIGRSPESNVQVVDQRVSRSHAVIRFVDGQWVLKNLGRNGVVVEEQRKDEFAIEPYMGIHLGLKGPELRFFLAID